MQYLEDMKIGQKASFGSYRVTREEVIEFASKYDMQPFHLSDEEAAKTHFGRIAASGWHTCAMTMAMIVSNADDQEQTGLGIDELRWLKPVYPGDTLRVETEIIKLRPSRSKPDRGSVHTATKVFNQHDIPVMTYISIVLVHRRPQELII